MKISHEGNHAKGDCERKKYVQIERYTYQSLLSAETGKERTKKRGRILVDTKYEFGKIGDNNYLMR